MCVRARTIIFGQNNYDPHVHVVCVFMCARACMYTHTYRAAETQPEAERDWQISVYMSAISQMSVCHLTFQFLHILWEFWSRSEPFLITSYLCLSIPRGLSDLSSYTKAWQPHPWDIILLRACITNKHDIHRCAMTCVYKQTCVCVHACADDARAQPWNNLLQINQHVPKGVLNASRIEELWCLTHSVNFTCSWEETFHRAGSRLI